MYDIHNLECLLQKFKLFTENLHKYQYEYDIITQRYQYFKKMYEFPLKNNHFTNCIWSNDISCKVITNTDLCSCYYAYKFLKNLCFEIIELIGFEYILNF